MFDDIVLDDFEPILGDWDFDCFEFNIWNGFFIWLKRGRSEEN